jgi:hypothetical protein
LIGALSVLQVTCSGDLVEPMATARVVETRSELIGGDRALGDVGDFLLQNDQIRLIIQGPGFSRGFGVYGGSLIDADLRRPGEGGDSSGGNGNDQFGELFPAFFLQAVETDTVEIRNDGSNGESAVVVVSGFAGEFLTMLGILDRAAIGSHELDIGDIIGPAGDPLGPDHAALLRYETIYELAPGDRYVTIRFRVTNITGRTLEDGREIPARTLRFPSETAETMLPALGIDVEEFTIPMGEVALFGATSPVFAPGAGFDTRFALQRAYEREIELPAFPGMITDWLASRSDHGVSYGLLAAESDDNFVFNKRAIYDDGVTPITRSSMLIPFVASSFLGVFYAQAPAELAVGEFFEITKYFIVGSGDVGSVLDTINEIQGIAVGRLSGRVFDEVSGLPAEGTSVVVYQLADTGAMRAYSQYDVRQDGQFTGTLPEGRYTLRVQGSARPLGPPVPFRIETNQTTPIQVMALSSGRITVHVIGAAGVRLPAKVVVVGTYDAEHAGQPTHEFLFDLGAGESFLYSDMVPDDEDDPSTRRYIEAFAMTRNGVAELRVRPGSYEVYTSRGPEYDLVRANVTVGPGQSETVAATLTRVVDTTGWIAADLHIHTINSIDSGTPIEHRMEALAAEGIEWAVSTDHNYVTDFSPYIQRAGLQGWMISSVGIEMTTLESGHFNGYPMAYQVGPITHGSFEWSSQRPDIIFDRMRALGGYGPENVIIQVNHPRDSILGYFSQYRRDGLDGDFAPPTGLFDSFITPNGPAFAWVACESTELCGEGESCVEGLCLPVCVEDESCTVDRRTTFSTDFDALEVFNGKRLEQLHHYRIPDQLPQGDIPDDLPPAGTILLDTDGNVAYPGVVDDWFNFLNRGEDWIAVGTSDTHKIADEAGYARSMIYVGVDDPAALDELELVRAMRSRRVVATNGPLLDFYINDPDTGVMGATLEDGDGSVSLTLSLTAAPWISVGRINIWRNGLIAHVIDVDGDRDLASLPLTETVELDLATNGDGDAIDSWYVVEAIGYRSMFPVVRPYELPALVLTDAIGSLAGSFGFGGSEYGDLQPALSFPVASYALTNPVWVTTDGGDFEPPGAIPIAVRTAADQDSGQDQNPFGRTFVAGDPIGPPGARQVGSATPVFDVPEFIFERNPNNPYDIRRIFEAFGHH